MEKNVKIKTDDNHIIYGVLNYQQETDKLIIFVHGLTGHKNEHQFYNAARFFPNHGFATFRFDLYSGEKQGRRLENCTIQTHTKDLEQVVEYFQKEYKNIYLVGHSLGGPTILFSNQKYVKSIVLWDPSLKNDMIDPNIYEYNSLLNKYIIHWGASSLMSTEMAEEWKTMDSKIVERFILPTKIVCAENGILHKDWEKIMSKIKIKNDFVVIKNAGHCFDEEGVEKELFKETLEWLKR